MKRIKLSKFSYGTMKEHLDEIKSFVGIKETTEAEKIFVSRGEISMGQIEQLEYLMSYILRLIGYRINSSDYCNTQELCGILSRVSMVLSDLANIVDESENY